MVNKVIIGSEQCGDGDSGFVVLTLETTILVTTNMRRNGMIVGRQLMIIIIIMRCSSDNNLVYPYNMCCAFKSRRFSKVQVSSGDQSDHMMSHA